MSGAADLVLFFALQAFLLLAPIAGVIALLMWAWEAARARRNRNGAGS